MGRKMNKEKIDASGSKICNGHKMPGGDKTSIVSKGPQDIKVNWREERQFKASVRITGEMPDENGNPMTHGTYMAIPKKFNRKSPTRLDEGNPSNN